MMEYLDIYLRSMGFIFSALLLVIAFSIYIGAARVEVEKEEDDDTDLKKEVIRLRRQLAKNHHVECSCSFCKPKLD